ncbi:MAG: hypothetical protein HY505_02375 [Candidatus Yanofskybacteria bacterium]|nr:hypothetical protein [Candidatus Yanofskybacteria bacterium]
MTDELLDFYVSRDFIAPVTIEDGVEIYDPFQIFYINHLEEYRLRILLNPQEESWQKVLKDNDDNIKKYFNKFLPISHLLQETRYYYLPPLAGVISFSRLILNHENWEKEYGDWQKERLSFDPKPLVKEADLSAKELNDWRVNLAHAGNHIDPLGKFFEWYHLIKVIRDKDHSKFDLLRGKALLAQDHYLMAEMLTTIIEKIEDKKILPIDDIFDGAGGKWRNKSCERCSTIFQRHSRDERYCKDCKKEVSETTTGAWYCDNEKCIDNIGNRTVLYKYLDNNEILNNIFLAKGGGKTETYARLEYGLLTLSATCGKCGRKNIKQLRQGWW